MKNLILAGVTCSLTVAAGSATAGSVIVDGLGGAVVMSSKSVPGVFDAPGPDFSNDAMVALHDDIHGSGITTDGMVTFVLADTTDGLGFIALVDDESASRTGDRLPTELSMSTTGPDSLNHWINDVDSADITMFFDPPTRTQTAAGHFGWNADGRGDGFAWSNLAAGDFVTFNFGRGGPGDDSFPGLNEANPFQFVSWNGEDWEVVANSVFSEGDAFAFSFTVIPLPAPFLLGAAGLAIVGIARRRMAASS